MDFISIVAISFIIFIVLWVITFFVLIFIIDQQSKFRKETMATFEAFKTLLDEQAVAIENISEDLKRLADLIAAGGISAVQEDELLTILTNSVEKLKAVAAINPEPAPEEPPVEG